MKINREKKTEVMFCSKDPENINIKMDDDALKQVPKFEYLGIIEEGKNKKYIIQRIKEAKVLFNNKKQLLYSNNFSLEINILIKFVFGVLLFLDQKYEP